LVRLCNPIASISLGSGGIVVREIDGGHAVATDDVMDYGRERKVEKRHER